MTKAIADIISERNRWRAQAHDNYELLMAATKFKTFVHAYLDQHGVPHGDPENQHQKEGCRIGARLDLMFAEWDAVNRELNNMKSDFLTMSEWRDLAIAERDALREENARLKAEVQDLNEELHPRSKDAWPESQGSYNQYSPEEDRI